MTPLLVSPPPMNVHNNNKRSYIDTIVGGDCLTQARRSAIPACTMSMPTTRMRMYTSTSTSNKNKKLRRNVSWNIQPSKILHLTAESAIKKQKRDHNQNHDEKKDDDDDNSSAKDGSMTNEIWYSVSTV